MNLSKHFLPALCSCLALSIATPAHAGWLTITNPPVSNQISLGAGNSHLLTLPGVGGTATVTVNSLTGNGLFLLRSYPFYSPASFSQYLANGLDPNGADQFVVGDSGGSPNTMSIRFDFTGLTPGFLPSGSVFTVFDLDALEDLSNLRAYTGTGTTPISSAWLSLISTFDANGASGGNATNFSPFTHSSGVYEFTPFSGGDIPTHYFITTQDIMAVTFDGVSDLGPRGYSVAFGTSAVPEPSTLGLGGAALLAGLWTRRRRL